MSTPTGSREELPIDGPVRQLFWRLRARLVTPPQEQRANADLDRLLSLARMQAHEAPSEAANTRTRWESDLATTPDHPLTRHAPSVVPAEADPVGSGDAQVIPLPSRLAALHALGRVAAAMVVVIAMGAGVSGARDGVYLDVLLGRGGSERSVPLALPEPATPTPAVDGADADPSAPATNEDDASGTLDLENDDGSSPDVEVPETDPASEPDVATEPEPRTDTARPNDGPDGSSGEATTSTPTPPRTESRTDSADAPAPAPSRPSRPEPNDTTEVVAAPDSSSEAGDPPPPPPAEDLIGAGGPVPCDKEERAFCLPEREKSDDKADDKDKDAGKGKDADEATKDKGKDGADEGDGSSDGDAASTDRAKQLAERRFSGGSGS